MCHGCVILGKGKKNEAWISYNSSSYNLSVVFTGFRNGQSLITKLVVVLDYKLI